MRSNMISQNYTASSFETHQRAEGWTELVVPLHLPPPLGLVPRRTLGTVKYPCPGRAHRNKQFAGGGHRSANIHWGGGGDRAGGRGESHGHGRREGCRGRRGGGHRNGRWPGRGGQFSHRLRVRHRGRGVWLHRSWWMQEDSVGGGGGRKGSRAEGWGSCQGVPLFSRRPRGSHHRAEGRDA